MKKKKNTSTKRENANVVPETMSMNDMLSGVFGTAAIGGTNPLSQPYGLIMDNAYTPLSLNRILLCYSYMTHGVIQTMIDQPVEDAFRGGLIISSDELDEEDISDLNDYLEKCGILQELKTVMKWAKLFGGAGLIINTAQDPTTELDMDAITEGMPLSFLAADRWELVLQYMVEDRVECPYNYYGQRIHKTRVIKVMGKEAPSFVRSRLQGWGMSEVERTIRPLNQFVKNEDVAYELMDEAKIDVWKIEGFNRSILSAIAAGQISNRLQLATMLKNFHRAIVMDKEDEYDQKQITFGGIPDMLIQNRIGIASAVRMPLTKLFGLSAAGFNAGEDDIENYNALVESEIRSKARTIILEVLPLCCKQLFGFIPESLDFKFKPLRVMGAVDEENIKTSKFNRLSTLYSQGILNAQEYCEALKKEEVFMENTEVAAGKEPEPPANPAASFESPSPQISPSSGRIAESA